MTKFFVYGTLKVGGRFAEPFDSKRQTNIKASTSGVMFSVGGNFPAALFNKKGLITGEVHTYSDENEVIRKLDSIEGFYGKNDVDNLYNRVVVNVIDEDLRTHECVAYEFNKDTKNMPIVKDGKWRV